MIDNSIPGYALVTILLDAACTVDENAARDPALIGRLPEPVRVFVAAAEPAMRALFNVPVQRELWPDAPIWGRDSGTVAPKGKRRG